LTLGPVTAMPNPVAYSQARPSSALRRNLRRGLVQLQHVDPARPHPNARRTSWQSWPVRAPPGSGPSETLPAARQIPESFALPRLPVSPWAGNPRFADANQPQAELHVIFYAPIVRLNYETRKPGDLRERCLDLAYSLRVSTCNEHSAINRLDIAY
jgi:hypothetical protein